MKSILTVIFSFLFIVSGFSQTRNVVVGTNDVIISPTNFWNANATNARTGLGLGTAATNPATSFQPSSSVLSNLASGNGINLTNIQATNIVGTISVTNIAGSSYSNNIQNFVSDVSNATNTVTNSRNVTVYSIAPAVGGITNILRLPTNGATVGDLATVVHTGPTSSITGIRKFGDSTNLITLNKLNESVQFVYNGTNWSIVPNQGFTDPIYFSGTNASANAAASRTNLGLGAASTVTFQDGLFNFLTVSEDAFFAYAEFASGSNYVQLTGDAINFIGNAASATRTNLGLGWSALTNSNAGTGLVSVDSNGSVVSPTNFWQAAPIASNLQTIVQTFSPTTNSTNAATNGRNIYVYSLSTNVSGITNIVTLPTNAATIAGDNVTVTHQGLTNSTTAIRQLGATNNLITINNLDEAVKFIYENGAWVFYHNISFVEPIRFSGTNASANAAASRTNLGLGATWLTNTNVTNFRTAIGLGENDTPTFSSLSLDSGQIDLDPAENLGQQLTGFTVTTNSVVFSIASATFLEATTNSWVIHRAPTYSSTNVAAATRANLGVPSSFGGGSNSVIGGGLSNTSSGLQSVIGGGLGNTASGQNSFVGGGSANVASSVVSVVAGGSQNQALGGFNGIVGGTKNIIDYAEYSFIGGGDSNKIVAVNGGLQSASIVGGWQNSILQNTNLGSLSSWSFIGGGKTNNIIDSSYASIVSGSFNVINSTSPNSSIVSGNANSINNSGQSFIGNGSVNSIDGGFRSIIVNGLWNFASNNYSTVINGEYSTASANYSLASGRRAKATNGGSFVFTDSQDADFSSTNDNSFNARFSGGMFLDLGTNGISFANSTSAAVTRSNLGIGGTNSGTFSNLVNNGNFTNNGTIYGLKTNVGPFEGVGNFFASNNTTVSNETLFRVGLAEATNRSAQFGFRVARTNNGGEGLAVFSVYGYNALMMVGPSDRSRSNSLTNTNEAIEADIYSISETNKVATLIDTNTGAFTLHRPIGFRTNETNASPTNAGNFGNHAAWLKINIGTNTFYVPVYQ